MQSVRRIDADLLGRIVLARFLELSLRSFGRSVIAADTGVVQSGLGRWVEIAQLPGSCVAEEQARPMDALARLTDRDGVLSLCYSQAGYAREYRLDDAAIEQRAQRAELSVDQRALLGRLRLINTRNRLTDALTRAVAEIQHEYLRSGNPLSLIPLTQASLSARLRADPLLQVVADEGRVSRLVRRLSVGTVDGRVIPLSILFPKPREVHRHMVERVIREEKNRALRGDPLAPLSDAAIAQILGEEYGVHVLRRSVAAIRRDLAIPDSRKRGGHMGYVAATEGFSPLLPLTVSTLRANIPDQPGVYEIRSNAGPVQESVNRGWGGKGTVPVSTDVVYIGSSSDLRKRLGNHLRGNSDNMLLFRHIVRGPAKVRYCVVKQAWRTAERRLYEVFCETFGTPPSCNRMSP